MNQQSRISDLLDRWDDLRDSGHPISIEDLCADCPELIAPVRHHLHILEAIDRLLELTPRCDSGSPQSQVQ